MLKLKTQLDIVKYLLWVQKFLRYGASRGRRDPSVNLEPANISESKRARQLKLKTPLERTRLGYTKISARGRTGGHRAP